MTNRPAIDVEAIRFRRPTEDDYPAVAAAVEAWWDDRRPGELLERLWLRHFAGTCWLAEDAETGTLVGYVAGFRGASGPDVGVIRSLGVRPSHRRRGIGRALVERSLDDLRSAGATVVESLAWPGNRRAVAFLSGIGFEPETGPGTRSLYGTPAFEGYDFGTEDRVRFLRRL